jgi:hypothetical protein
MACESMETDAGPSARKPATGTERLGRSRSSSPDPRGDLSDVLGRR